jgi:hypothetical protein
MGLDYGSNFSDRKTFVGYIFLADISKNIPDIKEYNVILDPREALIRKLFKF